MPYAYDFFKMLVEVFESGQGVLTYIRGIMEYSGTAGRSTRKQGAAISDPHRPCG